MASVWLAVLALVLAGPVPSVLARAHWPQRVPRAAIVLWQAIALAAVLAAVGSALAAPEELLRALGPEERRGTPMVVAVAVAATLAGLIVLRLLGVLVMLAVRTRRRRSRHRDMVDLLDRAERSAAVGGIGAKTVLRVLDGAVPFAYCLPGRAPRVVVTDGALDTLDDEELRAVLAHEQAHLDARHDLVREGFVALHQAFPVLVRSRQARDAVGLLLEMLADDAGRARCSDAAMAGALEAFVATGDTEVAARLERVRARRCGGRALATGTYLVAAAVVVVPTVAVVIPWLSAALPAAGLLR
ncbi:integral membrane protein [Actinomycetospora sp. NBRC 106375]|uniref:M56 family metallopeptidase n=1 Tax=Actinomycetospora sp. NBRC 106375 TaxID=3032207 RepID=UPI00249FC697|nr:M56 family metallopeptidase [Actinomycetospora sp. NBRC 106375]GLZ48001.1 integral membrane protein [Actinomycetospora sp. NBRC 106375]